MTSRMTSNVFGKVLLGLGLAMILLPFNVNAQSTVSTTGLSSPAYDITKEIKIDGTIDKIETNTKGGPIGTHLLVISSEGVVDVHLGTSTAVSAKNLGLGVGQAIHVTGMMATFNGNPVMLARIFTTPNRIYMLRNEHGAPVRSLAPRASASSASSQKGAL
jgi:hypothetical protein